MDPTRCGLTAHWGAIVANAEGRLLGNGTVWFHFFGFVFKLVKGHLTSLCLVREVQQQKSSSFAGGLHIFFRFISDLEIDPVIQPVFCSNFLLPSFPDYKAHLYKPHPLIYF